MKNSRYKWNEEFQEEDIWGALNQAKDSSDNSWAACNTSFKDTTKRLPTANRSMMIPKSEKNLQESRTMSAPVNIPADWSKIKPCAWLYDNDDDDDEEKGNNNKNNVMIPPHELIAKNEKSSFSVIEGVGRTLKGRDLSRVRYDVLTKTGFLESISHHYPL